MLTIGESGKGYMIFFVLFLLLELFCRFEIISKFKFKVNILRPLA